MSIKKLLFENYLPPIIASLVVSIILSVYSQLTTGNWNEIIMNIPLIVWLILVLIFIFWVVIISIKKRMHYPNHPYSVGSPRAGWENIGKEYYAGVIWIIRIPRNDQLIEGLNSLDRYKKPQLPKINVDIPPRCPECGTKLEISNNYLWYTWKCIRCGFSKRKWDSFYKVSEGVEKIVDREIEEKMESDNLY